MSKTLPILGVWALMFHTILLPAQTVFDDLDPEMKNQIDAFYEQWGDSDRPGYASAVIYEGEVVYKRVFGKESYASATPTSAETLFNIGALSHQQLIYGLFLLEEEGKLSLTDKLSQYLPAFSRFKEEIRLEHLLTHSSGLYDHRVLKPILGWKETDRFTQEDLIWILSRQEELSFQPGTDFAYTLTNIALLVEVMEKASGKPVAEFLKERVYEPLEMTSTFFVSSYSWKHERSAQSYLSEEEALVEAQVGDMSYGMGNVYTSLDDLIKWETYVLKTAGLNKELIERLAEVIQLPSGREYNMPEGKLTLGQRYIHTERGIHERYRTSNRAGFASSIFSFPEYGFTGLVLHNDGTPYNGYLSMETAYLFLEEEFPEPVTTDYSQMEIPKLSKEALAVHEGFYWDPLGELSREIAIREDTLRYIRTPEYSSPLVPLRENYFQMRTPWDDKIYIQFFHSEEGSEMTYTIGEADPINFQKYEPLSFSEEELTTTYSGLYVNEEYGISFYLEARYNMLQTSTSKGEPIHLRPIRSTVFAGDQWFMGSIAFEKNISSETVGFRLTNSGIRTLWFEKK